MTNAAKKIEETFSIKLTTERSTLLKSLSKLQGLVERKNAIPILANVKIDATDHLQLTVTDSDLVAIETLDANIESGGSLTVPAQMLYDIVRKLPDGAQISFDTDTSTTQLLVTSGNSKFSLSYLPSSEFPVMSEGEMSNTFSMPANDFLSLIEKTRFAMAHESTRYYLNGVYLHVVKDDEENATLKAVTTDGHRLALSYISLPAGAADMKGAIIPRKTVSELNKLFEECDEIEISVSRTKIRFSSKNITMLSKLVEGTFPDYSAVIPEKNDKILEVDADLFKNAIDRVSIVSTEKTRGVKFLIESGELTLSAQKTGSGSAIEKLEIKYDSEPISTGYNSKYILEMMSHLDGDTAQFLLYDKDAPAIVRDPSDVSTLYVLMPMGA